MSTDIEVKLSKEERRKLKEEKRARKAAKAEAAGSSTETESKKDKKSKKEKRARDGEESTPASEEPSKKKKKSKSGNATPAETPAATASTTPAESVVATPAEGDVNTEAPAMSKKQMKKLKAAAAAAAASEAASSSSAPAPRAFTAADNAYLAEQNITLEPATFPPHLDMPSLPVDPSINKFLSAFPKPTPIQSVSWPALLANRDVVGIAETGSGKTLAFGVPGMQHIISLPPTGKNWKGKLAMLVLAPTRELAQQSYDTLVKLGKETGVGAVSIFGGVGKNEQIRESRLDGVRIVVGTPGRTLDLADSGELDLSNISYLVLDEADRMLDQGFEQDIRRIIAHTPNHPKRQTVMCKVFVLT